MRGELSLLLEGEGGGRTSSLVGDLRGLLDQVAEQLGGSGGGDDRLAWLVDEVASVRSALADSMRRALEPVRLAPDQIGQIVEAVSDRVLEELDDRNRRSKRR